MRRLWDLVFAAALPVAVIGCSTPRGDAVLRDAHGNTYVFRTMPDGRSWMTGNLNLTRPDSYCYQDSASQCRQFGRLYTWAAAGEACRLLGTTWHLPTDDEWRQMAKAYGGVRGDAEADGQAAYKALVQGGPSGFNAVLGGGRESSGGYARIEAHGFYWAGTESDAQHAWFYNFGRGAGMLNRHGEGDKSMALAVRCIAAS